MKIGSARRLPTLLGLLLLAGGLCALAFSTHHHLGLADESIVAPSVIQSLVEGAGTLWMQLALFGVAFSLLHFLCGWIAGHLALHLGNSLGWEEPASVRLAWSLFTALVVWAWLQNSIAFHHSLFAWPPSAGAQAPAALVQALGWVLALTLGAGLFLSLRARLTEWTRKFKLFTGGAALFVIACTAGFLLIDKPPRISSDPERPHIIIIGIDSWRLDTLSTHGGNPEIMPNVHALLQQSQVIEEGLTSLARSYPSWWSVFSGQHPVNHGARFNLIERSQVVAPTRLTNSLGELGYYRIFAMDERRFANVDITHGFDQVVGPDTGAADFLLGTIADTPLTNLIVNTWLGKQIFPHVHGNRAAYVTYRPETFTRMLDQALNRVSDQPLFLAAHHELPHWPYHWAEGPTGKYSNLSDHSQFADYLETLHHADQQVGALLATLEELGVLQNSLLFLISDHGEAFETDLSSYHDPRMTFGWPDPQLPYDLPQNLDETGTLQSYPGHGTHLLSLEQHRIPIIFRDFQSPMAPGRHPGRATLADIYPTLMERLGRELEPNLDGISLLPFLRGDRNLPDRPIPLETGFTSQLLLTGELDVTSLMMENIAYYRVNTDGTLVLKPEDTDDLIRCKQLGLLFSDTIHAVIGQNLRSTVKMNISTGRVTPMNQESLGAGMNEAASIRPKQLLRAALLAPPCRN
ncbi:MAG: sulfatase-like hydrolase/transferase [Verrucomicrobia bacterium]|jgi:hypothetical protein|nr:sulfatase-like hydrolase/transferase [Verrucomicrobiota bacterium]